LEATTLTYPGALGRKTCSPLLRLQSDERLIALIRKGNHGAFEMLVRRYQPRLLAFCRHMLGSREDAEDVLQEVFAAAYNAILADEREINVRPWLYRIARNRSLNQLRRTRAVGVDSMDIHFADNGASAADKVYTREDFRELMADVMELPETQRTALLLREIDTLSYEQIAHAMDTTVSSVKSLLVRARVSLAESTEGRSLSCEQVRVELGEVAEGLQRIRRPVRRHIKICERCRVFQSHIKQTNKTLAMVLPVSPLLIFKKSILMHLGLSSCGGAAAGGAASSGGGLLSLGFSAISTKAATGLAAAALVTAGAVEVKQVTDKPQQPSAVTATADNAQTTRASSPLHPYTDVTPSIDKPTVFANDKQPSDENKAERERHKKDAEPMDQLPAVAPLSTAAKPDETDPTQTEVGSATTTLSPDDLPPQALEQGTTSSTPSQPSTSPTSPAPPPAVPTTPAVATPTNQTPADNPSAVPANTTASTAGPSTPSQTISSPPTDSSPTAQAPDEKPASTSPSTSVSKPKRPCFSKKGKGKQRSTQCIAKTERSWHR
jgi:RNA polymerase sigma factor (sigma-70 family)